ncbi:PAS domain S-box protein [Hydrogenophaga defluvii]|uniref:histidine kinase n=1 Tax=Hydrogenophaga defluvii TaxID=249410 RepID=A0ABW2SHZ2_9BURK
MPESVDLNHILFQENPDAACVLSMDGLVLAWSPAGERIFGYPASQILGQRYAEHLVPPDQVDEFEHRWRQLVGSEHVEFEAVRRRADGSLLFVDVSCRCVRPGADRLPVLVMAEKDVTAIKVQRDAKLMEARFRDLLESTPDGIVMANATGHIVIANSQAENLFGYGPGQLRGVVVDQLLPERFRKAHVGHRSRYFLQPRKRAMGSGLDLWGRRRDGSEFPIEISLSPLRTDDGSFVMSAVRDVSERKHIERILQEKNLELARANEAKDRFLASMSHELRTPLNAIIGFTGTLLIRLPGPLNDEQAKQLGTVKSSAKHLLALINDLLDVAKVEAGQHVPAIETVDLRELVEGVLSTLSSQAQAKGLDLCFEAAPGPVVLPTDRRLVTQIVINLVANGIKFTDRGGVLVALSAQPGPGALPVVEIKITDTGIGIPPEALDRLFDAFNRGKTAAIAGIEGTGLGLHLSQRLAHALGGTITVDSVLGQGSCFTLRLGG